MCDAVQVRRSHHNLLLHFGMFQGDGSDGFSGFNATREKVPSGRFSMRNTREGVRSPFTSASFFALSAEVLEVDFVDFMGFCV